jgi:tetratricopeptide (TPR) repeat protein
LIKQRMLYGEENISNYEMEAKIQALTSGEAYTEQKKTVLQSDIYRVPVLAVVNSIRFLMGKQIVNAREDNKIYKILEIGYFWERNRKYAEAINIYEDVLNNPDLPGDLHAAVMVHAAFCHSMLSEYDAAKKIYENVIKLYPTTEAGILSWKLLDFIESIEKDRSKVEQGGLSEIETAKQYYLLMDYRNAIKYYSLYLSHKPDPALIPEAHFYKGRSHEEVGETDEAIDEYNNVIRLDASERWAKQANRRILMLSTFYESKKQIGEEARKRLDAYQDMLFADKVGKYSGLVSESSLRNELMQQVVTKSPKKDASTDSLLSFINRDRKSVV